MNWRLILKSLGHKEMRNRILAVLGMLLVFRILAHIPVPLSDPHTLKQVLQNLFTQTNSNQFLGFLNVLSGGALANFSIMLVGLGPYINASIIMQLLSKAIPYFENLYYKEGELGRRKINQYTRILTFPLAIIQSIGTIYLIRQEAAQIGGLGDITANTPFLLWVVMIAALTGGAMVLMWLGELITERSIGNGISLLITVGIVSRLPSLASEMWNATKYQASNAADKLTLFNHNFSRHGVTQFIIVAIAVVFIIWAVVKLNEASRRLTVNYAKRVQGNRVYGGVTTTLPVKLITAGVIPIIFAVAFLSVPSFAGQLMTHGQGVALTNPHTRWEHLGVTLSGLFQSPSQLTFAAGGWKPWVYPSTYFFLVFIFTYFYTSVTFNAKEIAENLQKQGGFLAGIRSGKQTEKYLSQVVNRLTLFGAIALGLLAVLPIVGQVFVNQNLAIGGTSILILVAVSLETLRQVESRALMITYDQYEAPEYFYEDDTDALGAGVPSRRFKFIPRPSFSRKK